MWLCKEASTGGGVGVSRRAPGRAGGGMFVVGVRRRGWLVKIRSQLAVYVCNHLLLFCCTFTIYDFNSFLLLCLLFIVKEQHSGRLQ